MELDELLARTLNDDRYLRERSKREKIGRASIHLANGLIQFGHKVLLNPKTPYVIQHQTPERYEKLGTATLVTVALVTNQVLDTYAGINPLGMFVQSLHQ